MTPDRFTYHGPAAYGIEANVGVELRPANDYEQIIVVPRRHPDAVDPPPEPFLLLPIPALQIEEKARLLRRLAYAGRRGLWAIYLDTTPPNAWNFFLPPQWASPGGVRANLSYPQVEVPGPHLRLAGTFQSAPLARPDDLLPQLPPFDGLHLYLHPAEGWVLITAFMTVAGQSYAILSQRVIADPADPQIDVLSARLWAEQPQS